jgi:DNA invertase Pin-like site-specific DNA recombinase
MHWGWQVIGWYVDEAVASGDAARRAGFEALLDDCRREPDAVDGVLCWRLSRFGRDDVDGPYYRLELRRRGIDVVSVADQVPAGSFASVFEAFIDWKNRSFLDDMSRDVRRGLRRNVEAGYAPGGTPPAGYLTEQVTVGTRRNGQPHVVAKWVVDPAVGPRVTQAFQMAATGATYQEIHDAVGLLKTKQSYHWLLSNRTYLGLYKLGAEEFAGPPALVDAGTFAAVQARLGDRGQAAREARRKVSEYLLSGLLVCGQCGAAMIGQQGQRGNGRGQPWRHYRCGRKRALGDDPCASSYVAAERVEQAVVTTALERILTPETVRRLLAEMRAALADPELEREAERLAGEQQRLKRQVASLLDAVEDGGGAAVRERLRERELELNRVIAARAELDRKLAVARVEVSDAELTEVLQVMRAQVTADDVVVARRGLAAFVEQVAVYADRLVISYQ